jgi:hypothetical protein
MPSMKPTSSASLRNDMSRKLGDTKYGLRALLKRDRVLFSPLASSASPNVLKVSP